MIETCGKNPIGAADRVGCGQPIAEAADLYRCTDCAVPFHRTCAVAHFARSAADPLVVNWRLSCLRAEARGDKLLAMLRRMRQALGGRDQDPTCDCMRCATIRAFERFMAEDCDDRSRSERSGERLQSGT